MKEFGGGEQGYMDVEGVCQNINPDLEFQRFFGAIQDAPNDTSLTVDSECADFLLSNHMRLIVHHGNEPSEELEAARYRAMRQAEHGAQVEMNANMLKLSLSALKIDLEKKR